MQKAERKRGQISSEDYSETDMQVYKETTSEVPFTQTLQKLPKDAS